MLAEQGRKAHWVATALGVSYGTFRAIRTGRRPIKQFEAEKLADLFGVSVETFMQEGTHGTATG